MPSRHSHSSSNSSRSSDSSYSSNRGNRGNRRNSRNRRRRTRVVYHYHYNDDYNYTPSYLLPWLLSSRSQYPFW